MQTKIFRLYSKIKRVLFRNAQVGSRLFLKVACWAERAKAAGGKEEDASGVEENKETRMKSRRTEEENSPGVTRCLCWTP